MTTSGISSRGKRRLLLSLSAVLVLALVLGAAFTHRGILPIGGSGKAEASIAPDLPKIVAVYPVIRRDLVRDITLSAELRPYNVVNVYAKVSGYLRDITVDYGSIVQAGRVLGTLEVPEQEAEAERTEAVYRLAKLDYDRIHSVMRSEPGLIAQADVDKARAAYEIAKDQRDQAQSLLDYRVITAPFNGVVTKRYVDTGALIQQGTTSSTQAQPIVQIADTYRLRLVLQTPESIVPDIHIGTPVDVKIQATGEIIHASVARFSYDVHEETRTMHTEVDIPNADLHLKPGMYAYVTVVLASKHDVSVVPTQALSTGASPDVWVVNNLDEMRRQAVRVGLRTPSWVEVTQGLKPGERVFIGDRNTLTPGMRVRPRVTNVVNTV